MANRQASPAKAKKILSFAVAKGHSNIQQSVQQHGLTMDHPTARMAADQFNSILDRVHDHRVDAQAANHSLNRLIRQAPGSAKGDD